MSDEHRTRIIIDAGDPESMERFGDALSAVFQAGIEVGAADADPNAICAQTLALLFTQGFQLGKDSAMRVWYEVITGRYEPPRTH